MAGIERRTWLTWSTIGLLAGSCCVLAALQYRWITEFSDAEHDRLQADLESRVNLLARSFDDEISSARTALVPSTAQVQVLGRELAYSERYESWRQSHEPLFRRIALVTGDGNDLRLFNLNLETGRFLKSDWPADWTALRERMEERLQHAPPEALGRVSPTFIEMPRFDRGGPEQQPHGSAQGQAGSRDTAGSKEWLVAESDLEYIRGTALPNLLNRYVSAGNALDYDAEVVSKDDPSMVIYHSGDRSWNTSAADASVDLFETQPRPGPLEPGRARSRPPSVRGPDGAPPRRAGPPPDPSGPPESRRGPPEGQGGAPPERGEPSSRHDGPPQFRGPGPHFPPPDRRYQDTAGARWRLFVRHRAGSLEASVSRERSRNLVASAGLLILIVATGVLLMRLSRQSQRLAEARMNFVANVSHELRTPLTVIRTAAFNLRGKLAHRPDQVERYGQLIQEHSETLTALVEQILRFAGSEAGHVIRVREPTSIAALIEDSLQSVLEPLPARGILVEKRIDSDLPLVLADKLAMKHALQNLVENAVKHGADANEWLGVFASPLVDKCGSAVEIRIADSGPGIPLEEQQHIFDPFFRGRRALADQVHGTGLGLNLVKKIIEAHGGTIRVHSEESNGSEFIVRLPAAPTEQVIELAHSLG